MLDLKLIRNQLDSVAAKLAQGLSVDVDTIKTLEAQRREQLKQSENLQMARNQLAKQIGMKKKQGEACDELLAEASTLSEQTKDAEQACKLCEQKLYDLLSTVPNIPHESVPVGTNEADNVVVRQVGTADIAFEAKDHETLTATSLGIDTHMGAQLAGSRFAVLKHEVAQNRH